MGNDSIDIDEYGDGLGIAISCDSLPAHNWLSFLSWYSLTQFLPDAKVVVACRRPAQASGVESFPWVYRRQVSFFFHKSEDIAAIGKKRGLLAEHNLVIPCGVLALQSLDQTTIETIQKSSLTEGNSIALPAKDPNISVFCDIEKGCGKFVLASWLHRNGHPLGLVDRFAKGDLTVNERRAFALWKKSVPLFDLIG